jgi:hypothetical protein
MLRSFRFLALLLPLALSAQTPPAPPETPTVEAPISPETPKAETPALPEAPAVPATPPETAPAASASAPVADAAESAVILVYRQKRFAGAILNTSVFVDEIEIADMDNGTFLKVKVTPGEHTIHADEKKDAMVLPFEAGKTYYFRMALRAGFWKGHGKLEPVDPATGEKEFGEWRPKLEYAKDIRKPDMVIPE